MSNDEINIQPEAGILSVFSRLNYKIWYAIGEFVDNSTQSFYTNEEILASHNITSESIKINYDYEQNELVIEDNAYGMNKADFVRAIRLDSKPEYQGGRNEFGMGLKTAASWFGNVWSVESTEFGSDKLYFAEVDIEKLKREKKNTITVITSYVSKDAHGTIIRIKDITKGMHKKSQEKTIELLQSMYRRDLISGKINIFFNERPLSFSNYECLTHKDKVWKKNLDFKFEFDGLEHIVTGFVGILKEGSFAKAGFNLFRRNRVVIGGDLDDLNYKPKEIFGQRQSETSLKLFGELNLDDFPVNQAKDGFIWEDGLEEKFKQELKDNIIDYISIAKKTKKELINENNFSDKKSAVVQKESKKDIEEILLPLNEIISKKNDSSESIDEQLFDNFIVESNTKKDKKLAFSRIYRIPLDSINTYTLNISWSSSDSTYWIKKDNMDDYNCNVIINVNHPFFKPYINKNDFQIVLEKFVAAFVLSLELSKLSADTDGKIIPDVIPNKLNEFLKKLGEIE